MPCENFPRNSGHFAYARDVMQPSRQTVLKRVNPSLRDGEFPRHGVPRLPRGWYPAARLGIHCWAIVIRLAAFRIALIVASTVSVDTPRPRYIAPWCSTSSVASA